MKKILGILTLASLFFTLSACDDKKEETAETDKPTIKIGAILPLQGEYGMYGEAGKKSLMMFQEELKKRDLKNNYEFIIEPCDANNLISTINAARKNILVDKVNATITIWNNAGVATTNIVKDKNVIHMNLGNDVRTTIEKYNFNFGPSVEGQVNLSLSEMAKKGVKRLFVVGVNNAWSNSVLEGYKNLVSKYNIELVDTALVNSGEKNFRILLAEIKNKSPDMISVVLENPETDIIRKQMLEVGIKIPVTSVESIEYSETPSIYESVWYINYPDGTPDFLEKFKKHSGMTTFPTVAYIYDMATILVDAFGHANTHDEAVSYMQSLKTFKGATGEVKQEDNFFKTRDIVKQIKNGRPAVVEE